MSFEYRGRVAVVTGASSGIGEAVARDLASRGTTVVAVARRGEMLEALAARCRERSPESEAVVVDVGERAAVEALVAGVLERHGRIDVLVNNAGMPMRRHVTRLSPGDVEQVLRVNFLGAVYATLAVLPSMIERRAGHLVNIASVAARIPTPRESAYAASKHALAGWSGVVASDLRGTGVAVHLVNPGAIRTEIWHKTQEPPAYRGRFHAPERVAEAVRACLERGRFETWVPPSMRLVSLLYSVAPRSFIRAAARYDARAGATRRR